MHTTDTASTTNVPDAAPGHGDKGALRSTCPVAGALNLVGDRWTLLVVRDLLRGKRRYGDLAASSERIPTNILADRLRRLEQGGVVDRVQYSEHPPRYEYRLTPRGKALSPAIRSLAAWGLEHVPGTKVPPDVLNAMKKDEPKQGEPATD